MREMSARFHFKDAILIYAPQTAEARFILQQYLRGTYSEEDGKRQNDTS